MDDNQPATILVVDDEPAYVDAYATWLDDTYIVRTATNGADALASIDDEVDVALLDRLMTGLSGDEVLAEIRERGYDCRVAMITAVEPELDIIDMAFDEYLVKPVSKDELRSVVDHLLTRATFDAQVQECFALASKKSALESNLSQSVLETSREYQELVDMLTIAEQSADETLNELIATGNSATAYYDIES